MGGDQATSADNGRLVPQSSSDPFGSILNRENLSTLALARRCDIGHQGLFFEPYKDELVAYDGTEDRLSPSNPGLYFNRARWYDAERGRFTTSDPNATGMPVMGSVGWHGMRVEAMRPRLDVMALYGDGLSLYARAGHNPLAGRDPSGLETLISLNITMNMNVTIDSSLFYTYEAWAGYQAATAAVIGVSGSATGAAAITGVAIGSASSMGLTVGLAGGLLGSMGLIMVGDELIYVGSTQNMDAASEGASERPGADTQIMEAGGVVAASSAPLNSAVGNKGSSIGSPGKSDGVRVVKSDKELQSVYNAYSKGGSTVAGSTYPGKLVRFQDGSTIGLRAGSKSGGATIDMTGSNGKTLKVHIQP